uniref:L-dopachrome isomerase n=1 Tax=Hemiselmis andersenii TaxID=464988 RepID=A0A6U4IXB5_HEMAN|mmetsp:Transcript_8230/g.19178  ORF Transcript_8230/g.19178 Transcript_8230/m.19178 type:complete len:120 (+) Transcript_8230:86-445(+)
MPSLTIQTNVDMGSDDDKKKLMTNLTQAVAKGLGKPDSYVCIQLVDKQVMMWGGSTEPCALCQLVSLGAINLKNNKAISEQLAKLLVETPLNIKSDRCYIEFRDVSRENMGYDGKTFAG